MKIEFTRREAAISLVTAGAATLVPAAGLARGSISGKGKSMALSSNIEIVRAIHERAFNQRDLSFIDDIAAPSIVEHEYLAPANMSGADAIRAAIAETHKAVLQLHLTIDDIVESDDKVWTRCTASGIEATTGKPFTMLVFDEFRFENGKLVEHWGVPDRFAMLHQVGLLPGIPG